MENDARPSRREAIIAGILAAGVGSTALTSCGDQKPHSTDKPMPNKALRTIRDLANIENIYFVDEAGDQVNLDSLQTQIGKNYSTMSFMFAACGDVCPMTASVLANVSKSKPSLRHVVISVDPAGDFGGTLAYKLKAQGLILDGPSKNTIVIYPSTKIPKSELSLLEAGASAQSIQNRFELMTRGSAKEGHSGVITLFDAQGNLKVQVANPQLDDGIAQMTTTLSQALASEPQR